MNPDLNPEFDEVLLTAYLDDEVTDEERALVERQLRTSESSRKVLEELRSVRNLVVQLHMTQPNRSFQQGPWNEKDETVASSKLVLSDHRSGWNKSFQRLASLAALIAIAACLSVLMWGPKRDTMALLEGVNKKVAPALPTENSPQDAPMDSFEFTPASPSVASENALPLAKSRAMETEAKEDTKQESLGRAVMPSGAGMGMLGGGATAAGGRTEGAAREFSELESSAGVPDAAGRSAPLMAGSGPGGAGGFRSSAPAKPMAKQKSDTTDSLRVDPAPAAARMLAESDAGATDLRIAQAPVPAPKSAPSELYFLLPLIQQQTDGDWLAVDGRIEGATINDKGDRNLKLKEAEASSNISPTVARYTYRFRGTASDQGNASVDGLEIEERQSIADAPSELSRASTEVKIDDAANPFMIELQIPADKWGQGSERLRQLGFDVPIELPQTEYLDFTAIQIPKDAAEPSIATNTAVNPTETGEKQSNAILALGRQFRRIDQSRNALDTKEASVKNAGSKDELEGKEPAGRTRIRVRVMRKE